MTMRDSIAAARVGGPSPEVAGATTFEFRFRADDPTFAGHFPARPIVPGVFQIEMARTAAESVLGGPLGVREIRKAKFLRPILPEELVRMDLKLSDSDGAIQARAAFSVDGQRAGEAVLTLWRRA
jgi:3-hydroxymyristoyl/3-hydroxydecanoyl-(acyl carrier protein) dehydratase